MCGSKRKLIGSVTGGMERKASEFVLREEAAVRANTTNVKGNMKQ